MPSYHHGDIPYLHECVVQRRIDRVTLHVAEGTVLGSDRLHERAVLVEPVAVELLRRDVIPTPHGVH